MCVLCFFHCRRSSYILLRQSNVHQTRYIYSTFSNRLSVWDCLWNVSFLSALWVSQVWPGTQYISKVWEASSFSSKSRLRLICRRHCDVWWWKTHSTCIVSLVSKTIPTSSLWSLANSYLKQSSTKWSEKQFIMITAWAVWDCLTYFLHAEQWRTTSRWTCL